MSQLIFEEIVYDKRNSTFYGIWLALFIASSIWAALAFTLGDKGPSGFEESLIYALIVSVITGLLAVNNRKTTKSVLKISRSEDDRHQLVLTSPQGAEILSFSSPFIYRCGYNILKFGKGKNQRILYLTFSDPEGNNLLTLETYLGAMHPIPENWSEMTSEEINLFRNIYASENLKSIADYFIYK